nr:hypothetical protein 48 [Burkholderiaceae bacterium]
MEVDEKVIDEHQLLGITEVARMLNKAHGTVRVDATRRPETLPKRTHLPGSRRVLFRRGDVLEFIKKYGGVGDGN